MAIDTTVIPLQVPTAQLIRQQVVDILRNAITSCLFEPGGRLTERDLCERLGVGRGTVREGLRQLEAEGLVRIRPNRGPVVTVLSETEAAECYSLRAILEGEASAIAARTLEGCVLDVLGQNRTAMRKALKADDFTSLQQAKTSFYDIIFASVGNTQFETLLKQLRARTTLVRGLDVDRGRRMAESLRGAAEIYEAFRAGDAEAARRASAEHLERASALALNAMKLAASRDGRAVENGIQNGRARPLHAS
jgi:GntR family transcriptional regulator, trigonelline degradation regulator